MPSNRRLLLLAVLLLLLGLIVGAGVRMSRRDGAREADAQDSSAAATGVAEGERSLSPRRVKQGAVSAEAKLKSLLAVREGEMAFIHVPADLMDRMPTIPGDETMKLGERVPSLMGILNRELVWQSLTGPAVEIDGSVDASGESFEWRGSRMQVSGTTSASEDSVTLNVTATEGRGKTTIETTLLRGSIVYLRSSLPDAEGLLLVIGRKEGEGGDFPVGD